MITWKVQSWEPYLKPGSTKKYVKKCLPLYIVLKQLYSSASICSVDENICWSCHVCLTVQSLKLLGLHCVFQVIALISSFTDWKRYKFHDLLGDEVSWNCAWWLTAPSAASCVCMSGYPRVFAFWNAADKLLYVDEWSASCRWLCHLKHAQNKTPSAWSDASGKILPPLSFLLTFIAGVCCCLQ
jgi:hypothetical protein